MEWSFLSTDAVACCLTGNLKADGNSLASLKFQLPALAYLVADISDVLPVSSIHSLSSNVASQLVSDTKCGDLTNIDGTLPWLYTFRLMRCLPAATSIDFG